MDFEAFNYGKFYAFVNDIPNCDSGTKSCHCANKAWLNLNKPRSSPEAEEILGKNILVNNLFFFLKNSDAFAQWYREGTYPAPILEWREAGVNTNMMTVNGFTSDTSFRAAECAVLDKMNLYGSKGNLTFRRPLRKKLRMRWFFDVSKVKESIFFNRTLLTSSPLRFF